MQLLHPTPSIDEPCNEGPCGKHFWACAGNKATAVWYSSQLVRLDCDNARSEAIALPGTLAGQNMVREQILQRLRAIQTTLLRVVSLDSIYTLGSEQGILHPFVREWTRHPRLLIICPDTEVPIPPKRASPDATRSSATPNTAL